MRYQLIPIHTNSEKDDGYDELKTVSFTQEMAEKEDVYIGRNEQTIHQRKKLSSYISNLSRRQISLRYHNQKLYAKRMSDLNESTLNDRVMAFQEEYEVKHDDIICLLHHFQRYLYQCKVIDGDTPQVIDLSSNDLVIMNPPTSIESDDIVIVTPITSKPNTQPTVVDVVIQEQPIVTATDNGNEKTNTTAKTEDTASFATSLLRNCECSICMEIMACPHALPCGHSFCFNCIDDYSNTAKASRQCPVCKMDYTPATVHYNRTLEGLIHDILTKDKEQLDSWQERTEAARELIKQKNQAPPPQPPPQPQIVPPAVPVQATGMQFFPPNVMGMQRNALPSFNLRGMTPQQLGLTPQQAAMYLPQWPGGQNLNPVPLRQLNMHNMVDLSGEEPMRDAGHRTKRRKK